jgi:hypothetical protein
MIILQSNRMQSPHDSYFNNAQQIAGNDSGLFIYREVLLMISIRYYSFTSFKSGATIKTSRRAEKKLRLVLLQASGLHKKEVSSW